MDPIPPDLNDNAVEWTIRTLCRGHCAFELEEWYVRLNSALMQANQKAHFDELDLIFAQHNDQNIDVLEIVPAVDECLRMSAERALNICGVELNPDIDIEKLIEAVEIIVNFDPTDTPTILVDMLDGAEDVDDAFAKLMAQLGTYEEDDWHPEIVSISPHFTSNTRRVCKSAAESIEAPEIDVDASQELLRRLSRLVHANKESLGAELGSANTGLGVSLESLYNINISRLIDAPVDKAVDDIFSLAVISNESFEQAMVSITAQLDDLYYDMDQRRQAEQQRIKLRDVYKPIFGGRNA